MKKYQFENQVIGLIIEEDTVGVYLIVFKKSEREKSSSDYLLDTLEDAFQEAKIRFGVPKDMWTEWQDQQQ